MNLVRLGILVLTSTKKSDELFGDIASTAEEICVGHMQAQGNVKQRMNEIKEKFNLTDALNWREIIAGAGKRKRDSKAGKTKNVGRKVSKQHNMTAKGQREYMEKGPNERTAKIVSKVTPSVGLEIGQPDLETELDSFFLTSDGRCYESTAVVNRTHSENIGDGSDRHTKRTKKYDRSTNNEMGVKRSDKTEENENILTGKRASDSHQCKKMGRAQRKTQSKFLKPETEEINIHPSWAAKRKTKPVISDFKGSKITFG